jgi:hypothetical protein
MRSVFVVSKLLVWVVLVFVALHSIQRILRMAFAVAEQDIAALELEVTTTDDVEISPSREVLFACRTFVGALTCVYRAVNCDCATREQQ